MKLLSVFVAGALLWAAAPSAQTRYPAPAGLETVHIAMLYPGENPAPASTAEVEKLQDAHLAHIRLLADQGHALIAGPTEGDGDLRGIIMLRAESAEAARALEADDPAVKAGRLRIEIVSFVVPSNWFTFGPVSGAGAMRRFVLGFLNVGPNAAASDDAHARITDDHLANLWAMRQAGTLVLAGPAVNSTTRAGVVVLSMDSVEKAKTLLDGDPTVKAGLTTLDLYSWFAADGIMKGK